MKRKKSRAKKGSKSGPSQYIFCTECGVKLENFCFSSGVNDVEVIRKTLAQRKKSGGFAGEFCAKLFIAEPVDLRTLLDEGPGKGPIS
jgi:hypothetical protein